MDVNKKWMGNAGRIQRLKLNLGRMFYSNYLMISFYLVFGVLWAILKTRLWIFLRYVTTVYRSLFTPEYFP